MAATARLPPPSEASLPGWGEPDALGAMQDSAGPPEYTGHQLLPLIIKVTAQYDSISCFLLHSYQYLARFKLVFKHSLLLLV